MPGPAHLPTCLKDPDVSKQALNPDEPRPRVLPEPPAPPSGLSEVGAKIWIELAATLHRTSPELLTEQDLAVFRMLVDSLEMYAKAQEKLDAEGLTKFAFPRAYTNPAVAVRDAAINQVMKLSALFGLTPSHRATMQIKSDSIQRSRGGQGGPEAGRRIR